MARCGWAARPPRDDGRGINRKLVHLGGDGRGINRQREECGSCDEWSAHLRDTFRALRDRLRRVRVCCGDWRRPCSSTATMRGGGVTGVFLDPPYTAEADRTEDLYAKDSNTVGHDVAEWCREWGGDTRNRIILCGYDGEYDLPGWARYEWTAKGGYDAQGDGENDNKTRELLWLSPGCLPVERYDDRGQGTLFGA